MDSRDYTPNTGLSLGLHTAFIFCQDSTHLPNSECVTNPAQSVVKFHNRSQKEIK